MEFQIKEKYCTFSSRFRRFFLNLFFMLTIGFIPLLLFYGIRRSTLIAFLSLLVLGGLYCVQLAKTTLYRISFCNNTRMVKIDVQRYNSIEHRYSIAFEDFEVSIRKNFLSRYPEWVLKLYQRNKMIFKLKESLGWTYEEFVAIERISKKMTREYDSMNSIQ